METEQATKTSHILYEIIWIFTSKMWHNIVWSIYTKLKWLNKTTLTFNYKGGFKMFKKLCIQNESWDSILKASKNDMDNLIKIINQGIITDLNFKLHIILNV